MLLFPGLLAVHDFMERGRADGCSCGYNIRVSVS